MSQYVDVKDLEEKTAKVVETAMSKGASTAVADIHQKTEFDVEVRNGEIEQLSEAESFGIFLTVSKNGRRASVSSCDLSPESIESLVDHGLALCRYTDQDPFYKLPERDWLCWDTQELDMFDERLLSISIEEKIQKVRELEAALRGQDPRLKSDGCSLSTIVAASAFANSLGFCRSETSGMIATGIAAFAEDEVKDGDLNVGRKQTGYWSARARHIEDLDAPEYVARLAAKQVLRKLGARKPKTGRYPIYFEPKMAKTLWSHLLKAISGSAIFRNESYLVDRLGTQVCAPSINMTDHPRLPRGLRSRCFDNDGVASLPLKIVEGGELKTYIMNTYSASKLNSRSTGHAGGTTNILIDPGPYSEDEMIKSMGTGVWITSMLGEGANISTGDFSRGALGLWVEDGVPVYPIMEFTLNSHLDEMLKNISMLGNNVYKNDSTQTPGLVIGEMTISGS